MLSMPLLNFLALFRELQKQQPQLDSQRIVLVIKFGWDSTNR